MTTDSEASPQRRVRPWIAAMLTLLFGWGMGFFYARQTGAAVRWTIYNLLFGMVAVGALVALLLLGPQQFQAAFTPTTVNLFAIAVSVLVAGAAWIATARRPMVARGGPARWLGYLAIWLIPLVLSLTLTFAIRTAGVQPFRLPSGSMQPTLQVGQYFLVAKWSYGYSRFSAAPFQDLLPPGRLYPHQPARGDVVVFRPTPEPERDFVKRIVGLPGDRIQMIDGVPHINGVAVRQEPIGELTVSDRFDNVSRIPAFRETLPNGVSYIVLDRGVMELDNTPVFVVPDAAYFMLGDDRDNSADSRVAAVVGYVPFDNLVGRVLRRREPAP